MIYKSKYSTKNLILVAVSAFLLQFLISILAISKNPWTPFDEATHFDYVVKISKGHLPLVNEKYGQDALGWMACSEPRAEAWKGLGPCGSEKIDPESAPFFGQSPATGYPPHYYVLTSVPYEICDRLTTQSPIKCARLANSQWLNFSALMTALLMMIFGASAALALVVSIGYASLPAVLLQGVTVNSDAAAQFLAPALVLAALLIALKKLNDFRTNLIWSIIIFLVIPIKQTLIPIGFISTLFLIDWRNNGSQRMVKFRKASQLIMGFAGAVLASLFVQIIQIPWRGLGGENYLGPFLKQDWSAIPASLNQAANMALFPFGQMVWKPFEDERLVTISVLVGVLGWIALFAERSDQTPVGMNKTELMTLKPLTITSSFLVAIVGPVLLALALWLKYDTAPVTARYYMATAMTLGAIGIASTSNKSLRILFGSLMAFSTLISIKILIGI